MLGKRVCANSAQRWISWLQILKSDDQDFNAVDDGGSNPPLPSRPLHTHSVCAYALYLFEEKMAINLKVKKKDFELNHFLWRLIEVDGYPVAALYFNGREFSLSQEAMEDLSKMIKEYVETHAS